MAFNVLLLFPDRSCSDSVPAARSVLFSVDLEADSWRTIETTGEPFDEADGAGLIFEFDTVGTCADVVAPAFRDDDGATRGLVLRRPSTSEQNARRRSSRLQRQESLPN
jgi:hypothetical protein